ncbi:MAG: acyl-CoA reductase [Flavobacteriales bacterium]|nr:acyl-CoA reductase [Flavobacteriales bacterium]
MLMELGRECARLAESESELFEQAYLHNNWFTPENVRYCLRNWARSLSGSAVNQWIPDPVAPSETKRVGIVMAGNIPLVGLHDLLCVLSVGHSALIKMSRDDEPLMKWVIERISAIDPSYSGLIETAERIQGVDMVIATGSNNTSRYFEYYFRNLPHLIRKNRTGVAVLTGSESPEDLAGLGEDIFRYFGLGCRNVSKLYVPADYDFTAFYEAMKPWSRLIHHNKYANNYTYHKAIFLMNGTKHLDNELLLLKEDPGLHAPLSSVFYSHYQQIGDVVDKLRDLVNEIQCVVSIAPIPGAILPGTTQLTHLDTYADNRDTLAFLSGN